MRTATTVQLLLFNLVSISAVAQATPLRPGSYRMTSDNSHAHLSGKILKQRDNDTHFKINGNEMEFTGNESNVLHGMKVTLKPMMSSGGRNAPTQLGWTGTGRKYNPFNGSEERVKVQITDNAYSRAHPGLRQLIVEHESVRDGYSNGHSEFGGAAWRFQSNKTKSEPAPAAP